MVLLRCSQTFTFAEKMPLVIGGMGYELHSANPCVFMSKSGYMLNTRWINSGYRPNGQSRPGTRPYISANSLVGLDDALMPVGTQIAYDEDWSAQALQWSMGLQDVRFFYHNETVFFLAAKPVGRKIHQVFGTCSCVDTQYLRNHTIITPTFRNPIGPVEKNWVFFPRGDELFVIHSWHPLSICSIHEETNKLIRVQAIDTPPIFESFRGSTSAFDLDGRQAFIVHTVSKKNITSRKTVLVYRHRVVILAADGRPERYSEAFSFGTKNIEYCLGAVRQGDNIIFSGSIRDAVCCIWIVSETMLLSQLRWSKL